MHPKWSYSANIYEVNIRQYTAEGTFDAFAQHLPRLKDMGVKVLWFMPIYPISEKDRQGQLGSYYAIQDFCAINPEFGTMDGFKSLIQEAHKLNMKVIIDIVANHTGNDHPWIKDHPEFFVYKDDGELLHPHGWNDVAQLNYEHPEVHKAMIKAMKFWIDECNIDGYRCDMAHLVPLEFWIEAKRKISKMKEDLFWLAECEVPEYHAVFDATYTWRWMHASHDFYQGKMNLQSLLTVLYKSVTEFPCNAFRLYFTANHDENSWNGSEYEKYGDSARLFAVFSCTWNGMPMIYSGQEMPNYKRLQFFDKDQIDWTDDFKLHDFYKTLLTLKSNNKALRSGNPNGLTRIVSNPEENEVFSYLRKLQKEEVLVVLNCSDQPKDFEVNEVKGVFRNVFGGPDIDFEYNTSVYLKEWGYLVFEKL